MRIDFTETEQLIKDGFDPQLLSSKLKTAVLRASAFDSFEDFQELFKNTTFICDLIESIKIIEE